MSRMPNPFLTPQALLMLPLALAALSLRAEEPAPRKEQAASVQEPPATERQARPGQAALDEDRQALGAGQKTQNLEKQEECRQTNKFTRFWIHTVGAPMARGMKDGARQIHHGLSRGAGKVDDFFNGRKRESNRAPGEAEDKHKQERTGASTQKEEPRSESAAQAPETAPQAPAPSKP